MKMQRFTSIKKLLTVTIMCWCMLFISGSNFISYPPSHSNFCLSNDHSAQPNDEDLPVSSDESNTGKVSSGVEEDFLHEFNLPKDSSSILISSKYSRLTPDKITAVHFELISPPPKA